MTSYDQVWQTFLNNCKVSDIDLPKTPEMIYEQIKNAVMYFNNRMRTKLLCEDELEQLNEELSEDHLLILANYIRYIFLLNQKTFYESLWNPFKKDVGINNFSTQLKSLETSVKEQERTLDFLVMNMEDDFL